MTTIPLAPHSLRAALFPKSRLITNSALAAGGVAFLALMAQIALPIPGSPVPVTGQTLGALLIGASYGRALGASTFALYIALGVAGAPVFSQQGHGIAKLVGPTGGYLIGMFLATVALSFLASKKWDKKISTAVLAMLIGQLLIFIPGLIWLQQSTGKDWAWTINAGLTPFIIGEIIKLAIAASTLPMLWRVVDKRRT
ncbi:MAG: biotin transporter BioY [Actinomycetota bacterium]